MGWWVQCPQKEFSIVNTLKITGDSKGPSRVHECKLSDGASDIQMYRLYIYALLHHVSEASLKVDRALEVRGRAHWAVLETDWELKNVQMRTADSPRGSSPLAPSTVSPKYLPPPLGVRPPSLLPRLYCSCMSLSKHTSWHTNQSSRFWAERVRGVDELEAGLWVVGNLLSVLEPLVVRFRKTLLFHTAQLGRLPKRHRLWDTALWHHRFNCRETQHFHQSLHGGITMTLKQAPADSWCSRFMAVSVSASQELCHQNMQGLLSLALRFRAYAVSEVSSYSPGHAFAAGWVWS